MRFVNNAKVLLVRPDGSLDGLALSYLRQVLGADAVAMSQSPVMIELLTKWLFMRSACGVTLYWAECRG